MTREPPAAPGAAARGAWRLVARREIATKLRDRAFVVGTLITIAIICAFTVYQVVTEGSADTSRVAVTAATSDAGDVLATRIATVDENVRVQVVRAGSEAEATALVRDGRADVLLRTASDGWTIVGENEVSDALARAATTVLGQYALERNARAAGTSMAALSRGTAVRSEVLDGDAERNAFAKGVGFVLAFLFYMASVGFGYTLAGSVVEEKASRIVEIIATKIPIRQLLWGKVLGNSALALMQMTVYAIIGVALMSFTKFGDYLPSISGALGWFLAFFLVGFLFVACWFAVAGALASRQEDLQSTASSLTFLMLAVWFSAFLFHGAALTVASYVPPFSSVLMPMRLLGGDAAWWEPIAALGILVAAAAATVVLAERLYRRALMKTQGRVSIREAWRTAE